MSFSPPPIMPSSISGGSANQDILFELITTYRATIFPEAFFGDLNDLLDEVIKHKPDKTPLLDAFSLVSPYHGTNVSKTLVKTVKVTPAKRGVDVKLPPELLHLKANSKKSIYHTASSGELKLDSADLSSTIAMHEHRRKQEMLMLTSATFIAKLARGRIVRKNLAK